MLLDFFERYFVLFIYFVLDCISHDFCKNKKIMRGIIVVIFLLLFFPEFQFWFQDVTFHRDYLLSSGEIPKYIYRNTRENRQPNELQARNNQHGNVLSYKRVPKDFYKNIYKNRQANKVYTTKNQGLYEKLLKHTNMLSDKEVPKILNTEVNKNQHAKILHVTKDQRLYEKLPKQTKTLMQLLEKSQKPKIIAQKPMNSVKVNIKTSTVRPIKLNTNKTKVQHHWLTKANRPIGKLQTKVNRPIDKVQTKVNRPIDKLHGILKLRHYFRQNKLLQSEMRKRKRYQSQF